MGLFAVDWYKKDIKKRIKWMTKEKEWFEKGKNAEKRIDLLVIERLDRIILIYKNEKNEEVRKIAEDTIRYYVKYATDPKILERAKEGLKAGKPKITKIPKAKKTIKTERKENPKKTQSAKPAVQKVKKEKPPKRTKKENIALLRSDSAEERISARAALGIGITSIILSCPHCRAVFYEFSMALKMQWMIIQNGGAVGGGLIIHCPKCSNTASIAQYYESSFPLNKDTQMV